MIHKQPVILLLFLLAFFISFAEVTYAEDKISFEVGLENLPAQKEGNMIRDEDGFLWFCYYGGLGRYDGHEIKYYTPGENSISGPAPLSIVIDKDGVLWVLTKDNGLTKYDKQNNSIFNTHLYT